MRTSLAAITAALLISVVSPSSALAMTWSDPEAISDPGGASGIELAPDAGSDVTATWRDVGVPSAAQRNDGFWGTAAPLGAEFTNRVHLATNSQGDAIVVWDDCAQTCLYAAIRPADGDWEDPILVSGSEIASVPHYAYAAAIDSDGDATLVWKRGDAVESRTRLAGSPWGSVDTLATDSSATLAGLEVDSEGTAFALWTADGVSNREARLAVHPALGDWGLPETVASPVTSETSLFVEGPGTAIVLWQEQTGGDIFTTARNPDGSLDDRQTVASGYNYSVRGAAGPNGHVVVAWWSITNGSEVQAAERAPGGDWSAPAPLASGSAVPAVAVDDAGNAALAWEETSGDDRTVTMRTRSASGELGSVASVTETQTSETEPAVAVTPDGTATVAWKAADAGQYAVHASSTDAPISSDTGTQDPGDGGGEGGGGGDGGDDTTPTDTTGTTSPTGTSGGGGSPAPTGPALFNTLHKSVMPNVIGKDESRAKDLISKTGGIQAKYKVVLSHRRPGKGRRMGDVVGQSPKAGTQVTSGMSSLTPVRLVVYVGPKSSARRCPKKVIRQLRVGLRGMELVDAERIAEKNGCYVERNFRIMDVDEAEVTAVTATGKSRNFRPVVDITVAIPSDVSKNDLFLSFRESPNQLSFAADDWSLTASPEQRNFLTVTVKNRSAVPIPGSTEVLHGVEKGAEIHFDTSDVGAKLDMKPQKTDSRGELTTSLLAPKAGIVDVIAVKTGANGLSMYGIARLRVRDRSDMKIGDTFRTTGGRLLQRAQYGFFCKEGPGDVCKLPFSYIKEARASAFDPFGAFASLLGRLLAPFGSGNANVDAAKRELSAGRSPLGTVQAVASHHIQVSQWALSAKPLDGSAQAIAAGGGNVIAAGGGNVIAAGGGNVIAAGGGNAIAAGGGNVIAAGGGNAIAAGGGNVIAAGGGNVIQLPGGGQVIAAGGGNVIAAGGGNLWPVSSAIAAGGGNVIAAGGGNAIAVGGGN
jgi:beta-lactam-binding protein with PASTA domain